MPVTNTGTKWVNGALAFYSKLSGQIIATFDPTSGTELLTIPSGAKINIATGAKIQNNGVDVDLSLGLATPATDGLMALGVARATFDAGIVGNQSIAAHASASALIPANALVVGGLFHVNTAFTSASTNTGTIAISVEGANDIQAAAAVSGAPYSTIGRKAIVPKANTPESTSILTTAQRAVTFTVAVATLTAGKATAFLYYVVSAPQA